MFAKTAVAHYLGIPIFMQNLNHMNGLLNLIFNIVPDVIKGTDQKMNQRKMTKKKFPPTIHLFTNCNPSIALTLTLTSCMTLDDPDDNRLASLVGYYRPKDGKGFGVCIWPLVIWLLKD